MFSTKHHIVIVVLSATFVIVYWVMKPNLVRPAQTVLKIDLFKMHIACIFTNSSPTVSLKKTWIRQKVLMARKPFDKKLILEKFPQLLLIMMKSQDGEQFTWRNVPTVKWPYGKLFLQRTDCPIANGLTTKRPKMKTPKTMRIRVLMYNSGRYVVGASNLDLACRLLY